MNTLTTKTSSKTNAMRAITRIYNFYPLNKICILVFKTCITSKRLLLGLSQDINVVHYLKILLNLYVDLNDSAIFHIYAFNEIIQ